MSYPEVLNTTESLERLLYKKEFAQLKMPAGEELAKWHNASFLDAAIARENKLFLHPHQQFLRNFLGPHNARTRVLAKHDTGTGKTLAALGLAFEYIKFYKKIYMTAERRMESEVQTPLVFIIGFSKQVFQRELLRRPDFGFISRDEIAEHRRLAHLAETGTQSDKNILTEFESRIKKRLTKKSWGGFFKFFGYKEFFNRLFIFSEAATPSPEEIFGDEDFIMDGLKRGTIALNLELIDAFDRGFVICDEIHNTYNSAELNNYGVALRVLLNVYDIPDQMNSIVSLAGKTSRGIDRMHMLKNSTLRIIYLSATPINNSPTEIIDLMNLLVPTSELPGRARLRKEDYFSDDRTLKPGMLKQLDALIRGYVSFIRDSDPKHFPQRIIDGEPISIPRKFHAELVDPTQKRIPYLQFIRCPMSALHYKTYSAVYEGTLPPDGQSILDAVIPNPGLVPDSKGLGLFRSKDIKYSLTAASQEWKDEHGIDFIKNEATGQHIITGEFMRMPKLAVYSTKYAQMMKYLFENLRKDEGKVQISHQFVKMTGALFIAEILIRNGFLDEYSSPVADTLCSKCGNHMSEKHTNHDFIPARFVIIHGDIDRATLDRSLEKFRSAENVEGYLYRVIIGSKVLNEGIDLTAIQNCWVMSVPANIPTLLQIFGRAIRQGSHLLLPPERRVVHIKIFTSSLPQKDDLSYEEHKYFDKSQDYLVIQQLEKVLNSNAVDSILYRDKIFYYSVATSSKSAAEAQSKSAALERDTLGLLYYTPAPIFGKDLINIAMQHKDFPADKLDLSTFNPYYGADEIKVLLYIIKRLFIEQSTVWIYEDLLAAVKNPPFTIYINPHLFSENDFKCALGILIAAQDNSADLSIDKSALIGADTSLSRLFDLNDSIIIHQGVPCRIILCDKYYILIPIDITHLSEEYTISALGNNALMLKGQPFIDVDTWYRRGSLPENTSFNITKLLRTSNISYNQMKYKFYSQYVDTPISQMPISVELYDLDFHIHLVEDAIRYVFNLDINTSAPISELHTFYFKMLYFYDQLEMILFADQLGAKQAAQYAQYTSAPDPQYTLHVPSDNEKKEYEKYHKYDAFLISAIFKSSGEKKFNIDRLNAFLGKRLSGIGNKHIRFEDVDIDKLLKNVKIPSKPHKVPANMLPVGHFLTETSMPKIFMPPDSWVISDFAVAQMPHESERENDIIVGYYERNPTGLDLKFKTRSPVQKMVKHEDSRLAERGSVCNTRHKDEILADAKSLGIKNLTKDASIKDMCNAIKLELMRREMVERSKKLSAGESHTRWFYMHFEKQL